MPNRSAIISCLYATNPIVNKVAGINEGTIKIKLSKITFTMLEQTGW